MSVIMGEAQGQPAWLKWWFDFWITFQHPRAMFVAYLVAVIGTLIALALIVGCARKLTYVSTIVFSILIWSTAEGFGGPYTSGASDIGTVIIYAVVFLGLLRLSYYAGPARYSVDYYLESRVWWWWRLAELRRPAQDAPSLAAADRLPVAATLNVQCPTRRRSALSPTGQRAMSRSWSHNEPQTSCNRDRCRRTCCRRDRCRCGYRRQS